ncbi:MAG: hypothetical protein EX271_11920 [Acidimicrobiales bacterium]|nr:hypothetical protein [Hyphomonadaceae bacterium]RZV36842.1 MAG: hypothetical protein EX271_11920 [Acidimicrobiales bacterium]
MQALQHDEKLRNVYRQLAADIRPDKKGKIYAFASPKSGAGTSHIVRSMAMIAAAEAQHDEHVLILDMDLQNNAQSAYFFDHNVQAQLGTPAGPYDATFGKIPFWRVTPSSIDEQGRAINDTHFMSLHVLESVKISFSHFHWDRFRDGQSVHIQNARPFWHALREHFFAVFVDMPALDRANILSTISPEADTNILVSATADAHDQALSDTMRTITELGAQFAGVILNDGPLDDQAVVNPFGAHYE